MEIRQLKYFIGVAEELHFGNAAQKLFVSQPALSQQIQSLETELGVDLFVRNKRRYFHKVELTDAGKDFLIDARKILALCQKAAENAKKHHRKPEVIRLGIFKMLLRERMIQMLTLFSEHFPAIEIQIVEYNTAAQVQHALIEEQIDLGLTFYSQKKNTLSFRLYADIYFQVILPLHHPLAGFSGITLEMLKNEKWIDIQRDFNPMYEQIQEMFSVANINREVVQEVSSYELMSSLVAIGRGIGFVSSSFDLSREEKVVPKLILDEKGDPISHLHVYHTIAYRTKTRNTLVPQLAALVTELVAPQTI